MPRGLRGKLFRCNALPHRAQPAARISSAIFSSVRTRNSTNLESSRVVWHIRGVSLVLGTQERQVYPRGSQDSRGRPPSLPQPIRWGPRKSPSRKVLRNIPTHRPDDPVDQPDTARLGELLRGWKFRRVLQLHSKLGGEEGPAPFDAGSATQGLRLGAVE